MAAIYEEGPGTIVAPISELIHNKRCALRNEERYPGSNADDSDDKIKLLREQLGILVAIREQLEDILAGGCGDAS